MKKWFFFSLFSCTLFLCTFSAAAAGALPSRARIDINGLKEQIKISDVQCSPNLRNVINKKHDAVQRDCYLTVESGVLTDQWQEFEFSFVPEKSGKLRLMVRGNWTKKDPVRFVAYDNFTFSGFKSLNPDFETTKNSTISGWMLRDMNMCIGKTDAASGKNYVKCTHDFYIFQNMHVTAGKKATIRFYARAAESTPRPEKTPQKYERMK